MQPDNEKIIELLANHKTATYQLIASLVEAKATAHTLEGVIQILKVLDVCYGRRPCCVEAETVVEMTPDVMRDILQRSLQKIAELSRDED